MQLPALDQNVCGKWPTEAKDYYNKYPVYLTKFAADYQKNWQKWGNIIPKRIKWQASMGDTMRRVTQEWSPVIRQDAVPQLMSDVPTVDVTHTRERTYDVQVYRHRFMTKTFWFLPEWQDFFNHLDHEFEDLQKQITNYYEFFLRTRVFHHAPRVYLAGVGLIDAPTGIPNAGFSSTTTGKTAATVASWLERPLTELTLKEVFKVMQIAQVQIGMTPYKGSGMPKENKGIDFQYKLLMPNETFLSFTDDTWAKENRVLTVDITNNTFQGSLFGCVHCDFERYPNFLKFTPSTSSVAATCSMEAPETVAEGSGLEELNRTRPNPAYTTESQYAIAYLIGGNGGFSAMEVGPPPAAFTGSVKNALGMNWNGKPDWTKKFLVKCKDSDGNAQDELAETWGEHIRGQAQLAMSLAPENAWNVLPIIYKRKTNLTTVS